MNILKAILFLGSISTSNAQVHISDDIGKPTYKNAILQANTTRNDIKGFKFPRKTLTGRADYLTTSTDADMVSSMLIFNNKSFILSKGLYFWEFNRWNNLLDDSFIDKLSQVYLAVTKNSENTYTFSTDTTDSLSDVIRIGMNYDSNIFTDLSTEITNLSNKFAIINNENIVKFKTTGIIQLDNEENIPFSKLNDFDIVSMGIGLFLKSPGEDEFKLIGYSIIREHITSSCTKLPFNVFEYNYNMNPTKTSENYEVKVAFDKRDFSLLSGDTVNVSLGASNSPNCISTNNSTMFNEHRTYLPKGASNTFLTAEIFEIIN